MVQASDEDDVEFEAIREAGGRHGLGWQGAHMPGLRRPSDPGPAQGGARCAQSKVLRHGRVFLPPGLSGRRGQTRRGRW